MQQSNKFSTNITDKQSISKTKSRNFPITSSSVYIPPVSSSISMPSSSSLYQSSLLSKINSGSCIFNNTINDYDNNYYNDGVMRKMSTQKSRIGRSVTVVAPQSINYITGQSKYDHEVSIILDLLSEFNSMVQLKQQQKSTQICHKLAKQLNKIDTKHRSFNKIKSLVTGAILLALIQDAEPNNKDNFTIQFKRISVFMDQQQNINKQIDAKEYLTKSKLFKILVLYLQHKNNQNNNNNNNINTNSNNNNNNNNNNNDCLKQIKKYYKQFSSTHFSTNPSTPYYNANFWQDFRMLELLVYQYIIIVQKLAEFDQKKAMFLHKRGYYLAKRLLGKNHKFVAMVRKIREIGRQTHKLLKIAEWQQQQQQEQKEVQSENQQNKLKKGEQQNNKNSTKIKHKSLAHRRLTNILNPQNKSSSQKSHTLQKKRQRYTDKTDKSIDVSQNNRQSNEKSKINNNHKNVGDSNNKNNKSAEISVLLPKQMRMGSRNKLKTQPIHHNQPHQQQQQRRTPKNTINQSSKQLDDNMQIWIAKKTNNHKQISKMATKIQEKHHQSQSYPKQKTKDKEKIDEDVKRQPYGNKEINIGQRDVSLNWNGNGQKIKQQNKNENQNQNQKQKQKQKEKQFQCQLI